jgi:uncharacterized protein YndB with AHSA1/START domain
VTHPRTVEVDQFLAHPPSRVWEALTEPHLLARWLMPGDLRPVVGHRFTLDAGTQGLTRCEILSVEPERSLRMSWRNGSLDTTVTWRLEPEGGGTRLIIVHDGFEPGEPDQRRAYDAIRAGWAATLMRRLGDLLEALAR